MVYKDSKLIKIAILFLVSNLLQQEWAKELFEFAEYFVKTWINSRENGWYEGFSDFISNNNGLESINKTIKKVHTIRRRMKFPEFVKTAADIVNHWSTISKVILRFTTKLKIKILTVRRLFLISAQICTKRLMHLPQRNCRYGGE